MRKHAPVSGLECGSHSLIGGGGIGFEGTQAHQRDPSAGVQDGIRLLNLGQPRQTTRFCRSPSLQIFPWKCMGMLELVENDSK